MGRKFSSIAGDFVMDGDGAWWFIQVKAFSLSLSLSLSVSLSLSLRAVKKTEGGKVGGKKEASNDNCAGTYCHEELTETEQIVYPGKEQRHNIAFKDILLDKFAQLELKRMIVNVKEGEIPPYVNLYKLETKMLNDIGQRDKLRLYDSCSVCSACHNRYFANKKMMEETAQMDLAKSKAQKNLKKKEDQIMRKAVVDSKSKGGRGAVGLDDFLQNAKHLQNEKGMGGVMLGGGGGGGGGGGRGGGGGGGADAIAMLEGEADDMVNVKKNEGGAEAELDYDAMLQKMLDDNKQEAERLIYQNNNASVLTEEEQDAIEKAAIDKRVADAFEGYVPDFAVDIGDVMEKMDEEMNAINLGSQWEYLAKEEVKKGGRIIDENDNIRSPVMKFRPVHSVHIRDNKYWTNDEYKNAILDEVMETVNRGMKCRCVAIGLDENDLTSLLHSVYHEEGIKGSVELSKGGAVGLMGVPKVLFEICEEGIEGSMVFYKREDIDL